MTMMLILNQKLSIIWPNAVFGEKNSGRVVGGYLGYANFVNIIES